MEFTENLIKNYVYLSVWHLLEYMLEEAPTKKQISVNDFINKFKFSRSFLQRKLKSLLSMGLIKKEKKQIKKGIFINTYAFYKLTKRANNFLDEYNLSSFLDKKNPYLERAEERATKAGKKFYYYI